MEDTTQTRGTASEQRRMVLVVGVDKQKPYDFYQLLLSRLRLFASIMAVVLAGVMGLMLWNLYTARAAGRIDELGGPAFVWFSLINVGLPLFVSTMSAAVIRWRPPATTLGLRVIELLIIGAVAAVLLLGMAYPKEWYGLLERGMSDQPLLEQRTFVGVYVEFTSLRWLPCSSDTVP